MTIISFLIYSLFLPLYLLPTIIFAVKGTFQERGYSWGFSAVMMNLLFGWTIIGWFMCLFEALDS